MFAHGSENIFRRVSKLVMEKFIVNGDHIDTRADDVMNWWCPDPVHCTVSMCVERDDVMFGAIINDVHVSFSALCIKAVVLQ